MDVLELWNMWESWDIVGSVGSVGIVGHVGSVIHAGTVGYIIDTHTNLEHGSEKVKEFPIRSQTEQYIQLDIKQPRCL
ncbi:hypothetical protein ScPMuIL_003512 [Solemya velum]